MSFAICCGFLHDSNYNSLALQNMRIYYFALVLVWRKEGVFLSEFVCAFFISGFWLFFLAFVQCELLSILIHLVLLCLCHQSFPEFINKILPVYLISRDVFPFHCLSCYLWYFWASQKCRYTFSHIGDILGN